MFNNSKPRRNHKLIWNLLDQFTSYSNKPSDYTYTYRGYYLDAIGTHCLRGCGTWSPKWKKYKASVRVRPIVNPFGLPTSFSIFYDMYFFLDYGMTKEEVQKEIERGLPFAIQNIEEQAERLKEAALA